MPSDESAPPTLPPALVAAQSVPTPVQVTGDERASYEARLAELRGEAAKYRTRNDAETALRLKEQGDYKALYDSTADKAAKYDAYVARESQRLDASTAMLPPHLRRAIEKATTLDDKLELLAEFQALPAPVAPAVLTPPAPVAPVPTALVPAAAAAPGAPGAVDVNALTVEQYDALRQGDPAAFSRILSSFGAPPPPTPSTSWTQRSR